MSTNQTVNESDDSQKATKETKLELEIAELRRRVHALEEQVFRKHAARRAVEKIVEAWPGPFTIQQIEAALKHSDPAVAAEMKTYAVPQLVGRWEKAGIVQRVHAGQGSVGSVFALVGSFQPGVRPGKRYGRTAKYETGFRSIVRQALADADFPPRFTLDDLRAWMKEKLPFTEIPYGSWSSTLYKLQQQGELVVVENRNKHCSVNRKVYARGKVQVLPTGEEKQAMADAEKAWREFRQTMNVAVETHPLDEIVKPEAI